MASKTARGPTTRRTSRWGRSATLSLVAFLAWPTLPVPVGEVGEICIRTDRPHMMFDGYWNNPEATVEDLMQFVQGPDFPTGAQILGRSGILDTYTTGRGSIKRRAVAEKLMVAYIRAVRDYNDALIEGKMAGPNAAEILSILTEYTIIKDPEVYRQMTPFAVNPDGHVNTVTLKNDLEFFRQRKLVTNDRIAVDAVVDNSFADLAIRQLGPYKAKTP